MVNATGMLFFYENRHASTVISSPVLLTV